MNKEYLMNIYYKMCIFIGMGALLSLYLYLNKFPVLMNGNIVKKLFSLEFGIAIDTTVTVFNSVLIIFFVVFLINLGALIFSLLGEKMEGLLSEAVFYNTIITFLIVIAQIVFYVQIPDIVNGTISNGIIFSDFYRLSDVVVTVFNFNYILITVYLFYNVFVIYRLLPQQEIERQK